MKITFPALACFARKGEVCTVATPHPKGELGPGEPVRLAGEGGVLPSQSRPTALWEDGSVKWLLSHVMADLPAGGAFVCALERGAAAPPPQPVEIRGADGAVVVDTGPLRMTLGQPGAAVIHSAALGGSRMEPGEIAGPSFRCGGREYTALVGEAGWQVLEAGPVRAVVQTQGAHWDAGKGRCLDCAVSLTFFAGKPYVQLEYRFMHRQQEEALSLTGMCLRLDAKSAGTHWLLATSNYGTDLRESAKDPLSYLIDADHVLYTANEHIPEVFYGTFFADWRDDKRGLCVTVDKAYQNFPKSLRVDARGMEVGLIPGAWGELSIPRGVAKTQRLLLHFHDGTADAQALGFRSLQFQLPDCPEVEADAYRRAGLFPDVLGAHYQMNVERYIKQMADGTARALGMLHFGDAPDMGYTRQGRGKGAYVWLNNEYDYPHACMLEYARTGRRAYRDILHAAAEHWRDIDVCHFSDDPLRQGGQITHSNDHVRGKVACSHEWVEGLLDDYHLTGDPFTRETALGIAENVQRVLEAKILSLSGYTAAREAGWALRTFCAMYRETYEPRWLQYADRIVSYFDQWRKDWGAWLMPYTDHTMIRVPFMISIAAVSLMAYYRIKPQPLTKELIVGAVNDMLAHCIGVDGVPYYKELPSLSRSHPSPLLLHALAIACELTGDTGYLERGLPWFRMLAFSQGEAEGGGLKTAQRDNVVMGGASPKKFAQSYPCIAAYYKLAMQAGLLPEAFCSFAPWGMAGE